MTHDLVVLAAGRGTRFGGLKQLAPVGPGDDAIVDHLLRRASDVGFTHAVVVVRPDIVATMREHLGARRHGIPVDLAVQEPDPGGGLGGTAAAVLSCRNRVSGPFAVANADDLYPADALAALAGHLTRAPEHALVAFRLDRTLLGSRPVSRALIETDDDRLTAITEATIDPTAADDRWVSTNLWGFRPSVFGHLERAVSERRREADASATAHEEVLLPDVVAGMVASGEVIRVLRCESPCLGITYAEDLDALRARQ